MKTLHEVCVCPVKIWKEFPNGTHNDTVGEEGYFETIHDFLNQVVKGKF